MIKNNHVKPEAFIEQFTDKKILVIGDVMLDKYIKGEVNRISPESPVPILEVSNEKYVPGGAANVANNLKSLGAKPFLIGVIGNDEAGKILKEKLSEEKIDFCLIKDNRPTIQKMRLISKNQQLMRVDYEDKRYIEKHVEDKIFSNIKDDFDAIIVSDYAKGLVTQKLIKMLIDYSVNNYIPIIVDPKPKHKHMYKGVTLITPNLKEAKSMVNTIPDMSTKLLIDSTDITHTGNSLVSELDTQVLITRGKDGMTIFTKDDKTNDIMTKAKEVYDVSGAGDTVVAAVTLALVCGATLLEAANIGNHAAGIVVAKLGTSTVNISELKGSL